MTDKRISDGYADIKERWTINMVCDANDMLDALDAAERKAAEQAKQKK